MRELLIFFSTLSFFLAAEEWEEALSLRRIADFWEEGEHKIAKMQMEEFVESYPENSFSDPLCAALGDLHLREKNFSQALHYYAKIRESEVADRVFLNRMQCLYELQWYATLAEECEAKLKERSDPRTTYFLAIALYHQCLSAPQEALKSLAEKAKPLFEMLFQSEFSEEVSQGFAHLCFILNDYPMAASIYLDLSRQHPESEEDMLFQAALIQAEYDKEKAVDTFSQIVSLGKRRVSDAAYNKIALSFELGRFEELASPGILDAVSEERRDAARLFVGRSLAHLKKYPEALAELTPYVKNSSQSELLHAALLSLLDAAYRSSDLDAIDMTIEKLALYYPQDSHLPKAYFARGQILKKEERWAEAKAQFATLLTQFPQCEQRAECLFEKTYLDFKQAYWELCRKNAQSFLEEYPNHELSSFVLRYRLSSLAEIAKSNPDLKEALVADLKDFLTLPISAEEKKQWTQLLAQTHYELKEFDRALQLLGEDPNDRLLAAFCYRDGYQETERFCTLVESAMADGADLIEPRQLDLALFNSYLELGRKDQAAEYLHRAFVSGAEIQQENLLWLSDIYYHRLSEEEGNFSLAEKTARILEKTEQSEITLCRLAKTYAILGRHRDALALLEGKTSPEAQLIYAQSLASQGVVEDACKIFDGIVSASGHFRNPETAAACLCSSVLKQQLPNPDLTRIAMQLKNLVVQKNFEAEPIYLEAALEYVQIQTRFDPKKRVALLAKTKQDFESREDLLSKDYHEAKARSPGKARMYQGYMQLIEAEKLLAQAEIYPENKEALKEKSRQILQGLLEEQQAPALLKRVRSLLHGNE